MDWVHALHTGGSGSILIYERFRFNSDLWVVSKSLKSIAGIKILKKRIQLEEAPEYYWMQLHSKNKTQIKQLKMLSRQN